MWVLLYRDTDNPLQIPEEWPARTSLKPKESPWIEMDESEYASYRQQHWAAYSRWKKEYEQQQEPISVRELALSLAEVVDEIAPDKVPQKIKQEVARAKANRASIAGNLRN